MTVAMCSAEASVMLLQAVQNRLDIHSEHQGKGLHHVLRGDMPDSRHESIFTARSYLASLVPFLGTFDDSIGTVQALCSQNIPMSEEARLLCRNAGAAGRQSSDWRGQHGSQR